MLAPFECLCGNFILPGPASYVFFYALFNLRNLLDLIEQHKLERLENRKKISGTVCTSRNFDRNEKRLRSPAGPRRLGTATRISASLFRRLSAFFWSTPGQDPKAAKFAVLIPGPGMFVNVRNAPRVIIPPHPKYPCFAVCALACDFSSRAGCVPAFAHESKRGAFVGEVEKRNEERLGDKIYSCSFAEFSPSADSGWSQRTGKCMYIKAR